MNKWPEWKFTKVSAMAAQRNAVADEFFNNPDALATDVVALVREAVQNSLDQQVDKQKPVVVRLAPRTGEQAKPAGDASEFFGGLADHLKALGVKHDFEAENCDYLVFEDFNTTGLQGNPDTNHDDGSKNDFLYFFRMEGKSNKQSNKERGKWGIGKTVFPMSSKIFSFFGFSVRENDSYGEKSGFVFGKSTMTLHSIGATDYLPDGWWGEQVEDEAMVTPLISSALIDVFKNDWSISRHAEPGLSLVVPYLRQGEAVWNAENLVRATIEDYFSPILRGQLEVVISKGSDEEVVITAKSIDSVIENLSDEEFKIRIKSSVDILRWSLVATPHVLEFEPQGAPVWSAVNSATAGVEAARKEFEESGRVLIRVPLVVDPIYKPEGVMRSETTFDVVLVEELSVRATPLFIRSGIMIKQALQDGRKIIDARGYVLVDETPASNFLGNAEGPAHVTWSSDTKAFKDVYNYGPSWLNWVKHSPLKLMDLLRGSSDEPDMGIADEFFPEVALPSRGQERKQGPGVPRPPARTKFLARITEISGGVSIHLDPKAEPVEKIKVRVAYDVRRGDAFGKWVQTDFDLEAGSPGSVISAVTGGAIQSVVGNVMNVNVLDQSSFNLKLTGFDSNRDLLVDVQAGVKS